MILNPIQTESNLIKNTEENNIKKEEDLEDYKEIKYNIKDYKEFNSINIFQIYLLVINASLGFFYIGYSVCVFNGIIPILSLIFEWNEDDEKRLIPICSALLPIGALLGGMVFGFISNKLGRRMSLILNNSLSIIGMILSIIPSQTSLIIGRFLIGSSVGGFTAVTPIYIQEYVPTKYEGRFGGLNFMFLSTGVITCFLISLPLPILKENVDLSDKYWMFLCLFPCITNIISIFCFVFIYKIDTPYYLSIQNNDNNEKCYESLNIVYKDRRDCDLVVKMFNQIKENHIKTKTESGMLKDFRILCSKKYRIRFVIGILLNIFQQMTGSLVFNFYSNLIFLKNEPDVNSLLFSAMFSLSEFVSNIILFLVIDKFGRKTMIFIGVLFVFSFLLCMSILYFLDIGHSIQKFIVICYYFSLGLCDPTLFILNADLLPEIAAGICSSVNWSFSILVIFLFPILSDENVIGLKGVFMIFAGFTLVYLVFIVVFLKDTSNKTYHEIEMIYMNWFGYSNKKINQNKANKRKIEGEEEMEEKKKESKM